MEKGTYSRLTLLSATLKASARREGDIRPVQIAAGIDKDLAASMECDPFLPKPATRPVRDSQPKGTLMGPPVSPQIAAHLREYRKQLLIQSTSKPGVKSQLQSENEAEDRMMATLAAVLKQRPTKK